MLESRSNPTAASSMVYHFVQIAVFLALIGFNDVLKSKTLINLKFSTILILKHFRRYFKY